MSGGSMDYLYSRVRDANFRTDTPERRAFAKHLEKVAKALHDIEWVDSGDCGPGDETAAILACLGSGSTLRQCIEDAKRARDALSAEIEKAEADARRYRWLRDNPWPPHIEAMMHLHENARFDAAIDAELAKDPK